MRRRQLGGCGRERRSTGRCRWLAASASTAVEGRERREDCSTKTAAQLQAASASAATAARRLRSGELMAGQEPVRWLAGGQHRDRHEGRRCEAQIVRWRCRHNAARGVGCSPGAASAYSSHGPMRVPYSLFLSCISVFLVPYSLAVLMIFTAVPMPGDAAGLCLRACKLCVQLWLAAGPGPGLLGVTKD